MMYEKIHIFEGTDLKKIWKVKIVYDLPLMTFKKKNTNVEKLACNGCHDTKMMCY